MLRKKICRILSAIMIATSVFGAITPVAKADVINASVLINKEQLQSGIYTVKNTTKYVEEGNATGEEFRQMLPDAVSCVVILKIRGQEPRLCLSREYRYPAGHFLLSVPAGLLDPEDATEENPVFHAAARELREETGITLEESDSIRLVNPLVFSTPGMTDESNALVQIILNREEMPKVSQEGAVGTECFDGFLLLTKEEAQKILKDGVDDQGFFYPLYTWAALMCFATGMWK